MKQRILSLILAVMMIFAVALTSSAQEAPVLIFESSYNAETNLVSVSVYIDNAVGLQGTDLNLGYDPEMYEYEDSVFADINSGLIMGGDITETPGLCTCSVVFLNECTDADLDADGRLSLATFTFKPLSDAYDINEFYLWANSYMVGDTDIVQTVTAQGNKLLSEDKTDEVTMPSTTKGADETTTKKETEGVSGDVTTKWYVYLIAGVLAVGAIAGIAFVAIKSSHNEENGEEAENTENKENSEE